MRRSDEWAGAATAAAAGIAALAVLGLALPRVPLVSMIGQLLPLLGLALLPLALGLAALRRRRRAAGVALLALGILGLTGWRFADVSAEATAAPDAGVPFTLISFNALYSNREGVSAIPALLASGADAILILEAQQFQAELPRLAQAYPYRLGCTPPEPCDTLLLSRRPPVQARQTWLGAVPAKRFAQFAFDLDGWRVTLVGAHLTKPYFDELPAIERLVLANRLRAIDGPLILVGDFNATQWSPDLRWLAKRADMRFSGFYVPTWPAAAGGFGLPIDHVLTRGATVLSLEPLPSAFGSNHRGLVARLRIP
ncbi:hypothetical protein D3218_03560 [Aureimonas flava]|uniref:Endonuclease/exonuclease/phosphatase domain-containing protein n=1 Tax=Aureimonas flava TaxID=2320271 RepID=A0A3A1WUY1_9HYPH|nr:endonuclease/exonuclease/phosphatase family protein [Aureimonas flava]RIY02461.1 hypothetical protein D3218_03560 [Aureimonas flava]